MLSIALVLSLAGILAFSCFAVNDWIDHRLRAKMSDSEWREELEYREFLRSSWFGLDRARWLADKDGAEAFEQRWFQSTRPAVKHWIELSRQCPQCGRPSEGRPIIDTAAGTAATRAMQPSDWMDLGAALASAVAGFDGLGSEELSPEARCVYSTSMQQVRAALERYRAASLNLPET